MSKTNNQDKSASIRETSYILSRPDLVEAIRQGEEDMKNGDYEIVDVEKL